MRRRRQIIPPTSTPVITSTGAIAHARRLCFGTTWSAMPSEKAKENKKLVASCAGCGKTLSTELLTGIVVGAPPKRQLVAVCAPCLESGWTPEAAAAAN
ncbi:MAG: hypothetical protein A3J75_02925 [Acidobacteria bacterium RBG_16_68_9]|nr:MAG: hypothetical protein A3J75_02925 [Acidobacteria bacterium RBG_16_68_9]